jgi:hypothetical protein
VEEEVAGIYLDKMGRMGMQEWAAQKYERPLAAAAAA